MQYDVMWCQDKATSTKSSDGRKRKGKMSRDPVSDSKAIPGARTMTVQYSEPDRILGQTVAVLVLMDFSSVTPNLLARTVETVRGGGAVVIALDGLASVDDVADLTLRSTRRFRSGAAEEVTGRYPARLLKSLMGCRTAVFMTPDGKMMDTGDNDEDEEEEETVKPGQAAAKLAGLVRSLPEGSVAATIVPLAATVDQGTVVRDLIEHATDDRLLFTVTAGRGRGKSAGLGLGVAAALYNGVSKAVLTAPTIANIQQVLAFTVRGLTALGYDIIQHHTEADRPRGPRTSPQRLLTGLTVRRPGLSPVTQSVTFMDPNVARAGPSELLVIDEAAAIPAPVLSGLLAADRIVMASTVNGYEGTGRALALKLLKRTIDHPYRVSCEMAAPIRYRSGDPVEAWLYGVLCLDLDGLSAVPTPIPRLDFPQPTQTPAPAQWELCQVSRDRLFSGTPQADTLLHEIMAVLAGAHYRFSPDDVQLLADGPAQRLFVLFNRSHYSTSEGDVVSVIQINIEGGLDLTHVTAQLDQGMSDQGDLIPWTLASHHRGVHDDFPALRGARVVRIATHPAYQGLGLGSAALERVEAFYRDDLGHPEPAASPALLTPAPQAVHDEVDWLGTSFGVTAPLLRFWGRQGYVPVHTRSTPSSETGEHSTILIKALDDGPWVAAFRQHFVQSLDLSKMPALTVDVAADLIGAPDCFTAATPASLATIAATLSLATLPDDEADFTGDIEDLRRFGEGHAVEYTGVATLVPGLARLAVAGQLSPFVETERNPARRMALSRVLLALGMMRMTLPEAEAALDDAALMPKVVELVLAFVTEISRIMAKTEEDVVEAGKRKALGLDEM